MSAVSIAEGAHSRLGPSGSKKWLNCPASVRTEAQLPDEQSEFAASGTASHTLSEWCRNAGVRCEQFLGTELVVGKHKFIVDQERCDSVNRFCEYVYDLGGDMYVEQRVSYEKYVPGGFGTMDHAAVVPFVAMGAVGHCAHIVDFKDGEGVQVFAEKNTQLMLYALGFWLKYGWLYPGLTRFVLHIVQPRLNHFDKWEISVEDLLEWANTELRAGYVATLAADPVFSPGEWCSECFCRARRNCKARANEMLRASIADFEDLDALPAEPKPAGIGLMSNDQVAKIYPLLAQVKKWASEVQGFVVRELMHGRPVGDYKLVAGRSSRVFDKPPEAVALAVHDSCPEIAPADLWTEPEFKSVAQIEDLVGKKHFAPETDKKPAGDLAHLVRRIDGKPTVAPGSDRRPAITVDTTKEFEDLDANEDDPFNL